MSVGAFAADQAEGLRRLLTPSRARILAVAGGAGAGRRTVLANLAVALARRGRRVALIDAGAQVFPGPGLGIEEALARRRPLGELARQTRDGVRVVPCPGVERFAALDSEATAWLVDSFGVLEEQVDELLVATGRGLDGPLLPFCAAAGEVLVVVSEGADSITEAYALIKLLSRDFGLRRFGILLNRVDPGPEADGVFGNIERVAGRFLDADLFRAGVIPRDPRVGQAAALERVLLDAYPASPAALAFRRLAEESEAWAAGQGGDGLEGFARRLVSVSRFARDFRL